MTELAHLLAPMNAVLFTLGNDHVSVAELLGFVTGAASVVLGFAGWWQWLHGGQDRSRLAVARSSWQLLAACGLFTVLGTWGLTALLEHANDIAPFWDALTTAVSLAAQFLLNCKKIENWAFWIAADLVCIPLYVVKRLDLTAIVYVLFLAMCFAGAAGWRRCLRSGAARVAASAAAAPGGIPA